MTRAALLLLAWAALNLGGCAEKPEHYERHPLRGPKEVSAQWAREDSVQAAEFVGISTTVNDTTYVSHASVVDWRAATWKTVSTTGPWYTVTVEFHVTGSTGQNADNADFARWACRDAARAFPQDRFHWDAVRVNVGGVAQYEMVAPVEEK